MRKRLFIFSALLFFLIGTHNTFAQVSLPSCGADVSYHVTGNPLDTCLVAGNSITFNYVSPVIFSVTDISTGAPIWTTFTSGTATTADWPLPVGGTYLLQIFEATGNWWAPYIPLCEDTINIAQGHCP